MTSTRAWFLAAPVRRTGVLAKSMSEASLASCAACGSSAGFSGTTTFAPRGIGSWSIAKLHVLDGLRGYQLVALAAGGRPDEEVGRGARVEGLDEDLILAPFDLVGRASGSHLYYRLSQFDDAQVIQGCGYPHDLLWVGLLGIDSLRVGRQRYRDNGNKNFPHAQVSADHGVAPKADNLSARPSS
jgi:hypothetical protein